MRIMPGQSLPGLGPDTVITDELYDKLRYGNTSVAMWVDAFGSASAVRTACEAFEARNGRRSVLHALHRMYNVHVVAESIKKHKKLSEPDRENYRKKQLELREELEEEYAKTIAFAYRTQVKVNSSKYRSKNGNRRQKAYKHER